MEGIFVWDEDQAALDGLLASRGEKIEGVSTDLEAILSEEDILFVIAPLRTDRCVDICLRTLEAGKHILAEKPLGRTATDTKRVVEAAERAGLQVGISYTNRYHPIVQRARDLVHQGVIGALTSVEVRMLTTKVGIRDPKQWLFQKSVAGGGILAWLGCHFIDLMRYVTGDEIISVAADVATRSGEDIDVEDIAALSLRFRSGAVGSLHAGYTMAFSNWGERRMRGYDMYLGFNGREGRVFWDRTELPTSLHVESALGAWQDAPIWEFTVPSLPESPAYGGVHGEEFVRDFIRAAQGNGQVPASGRDALQVARVIDAAYESSRTGRRVDIEFPA